MIIKRALKSDINEGFLTCLSALAEVGLTVEKAKEIYDARMNVETFVAEINGKIVGTASLIIEKKYLHKGKSVGHIEDVAVHPEYQGEGIGKELVQFLVDQCKEIDCYKVILDCADNVQFFYEKLGFKFSAKQMRLDLCVE